MLISSAVFQIQRVESFCALLQGLLARQRELYSRSTGWAMDPANVNVAFSTRAVRQGAIDSGDEPTEKGSSVLPVGGTNPSAPPLGVVDQTFFYSMVWGLGGSLTGDPALAFDVYVRDLVQVCRQCLYFILPPVTQQPPTSTVNRFKDRTT